VVIVKDAAGFVDAVIIAGRRCRGASPVVPGWGANGTDSCSWILSQRPSMRRSPSITRNQRLKLSLEPRGVADRQSMLVANATSPSA
jgi:hypothetical protein